MSSAEARVRFGKQLKKYRRYPVDRRKGITAAEYYLASKRIERCERNTNRIEWGIILSALSFITYYVYYIQV